MTTTTTTLAEEIAALRAQLANRDAEYREMVIEHDNEARLYRATISHLRDEVSRMTTLAEGNDKALTIAINQRDQAIDLLRKIDQMLIEFIRPQGT